MITTSGTDKDLITGKIPCKKNFIVHFPNGERDDIGNDNIISESLSFNESLCSKSELDFSSCEASSIEFETFGIENIKGDVIECSMEYVVEDGTRIVGDEEESQDQSSTGQLFYFYGMSSVGVKPNTTLKIIFSDSLDGHIASANVEGWLGKWEMDIASDGKSASITWLEEMNKVSSYGMSTSIYVYAEDGFTGSGTAHLDYYMEEYSYSVPYGTFIIDSCKKQSDMTHRKVIAYSSMSYGFTIPKLYAEMLSKLMFPFTSVSLSLYGMTDAIVSNAFERSWTALTSSSTSSYDFYLDDAKTKKLTLEVKEFTIPYILGCINLHIYQRPSDSIYYDTIELIKEACADYLDSEVIGDNPFTLENTYLYLSNGSVASKYTEDFEYKTLVLSDLLDATSEFIIPAVLLQTIPQKKTASSIVSSNYVQAEYDSSAKAIKFTTQTIKLVSNITYTDDETTISTASTLTAYYCRTAGVLDSTFAVPTKYEKKSITCTDKSTKTVYSITDASLTQNFKSTIAECAELLGKFVHFTRDGDIEFVVINDNFSDPSETISKSEYSSIWYEDESSKKYGRVGCTYKASSSDTEGTYTYYDIVDDYDADKYKLYSITNNAWIKNSVHTEDEIQSILQAIAPNIKDITFLPMEITMSGRPDIEAGDVVNVETDDGTLVCFVEKRSLDGIQNLQDSISSEDDDTSTSISDMNTLYDSDTETLIIY